MTPWLRLLVPARPSTRLRDGASLVYGAGLGCDCGDCFYTGVLAAPIPAQRPSGVDVRATVRA